MPSIKPKCKYFGICGACQHQDVDPFIQIQTKQQMLVDLFTAQGIKDYSLLDPITGPIWNYRRKARLGVKYVFKKEKVLVGFRESQKRYLTDMDSCEILTAKVANMIPDLKTMIAELEAFKTIPQIEVACGDKDTALVFRHLEPLCEADINTLKAFAKQHDIQLYLQPKGPKTVHMIYPENHPERLWYELPEYNIRLQFHPMDFTQVNADINKSMIAKAIELLELKSDDTVLDLFCGLGNFSLPMAKHSKHVVGIEGSEEMVERAMVNANNNQITNTNFYAADLTEPFSNSEWANQPFNKLLIDPPRSGAAKVIEQIASINPERIVYVSCNPETLATDTALLTKQHGYTLSKAGVLDMFPHTEHVESIALFVM